MDRFSDEQLVDGFREGRNPEFFDELVHRHIGRVRAVIYPMVMNSDDADDLTQEVFIRAARYIDGFKWDARFSTWLYRIAINATRTFLKQKARRSVDFVENLPERADESVSGPDKASIEGERDAAIGCAMAGLSPEQREAISLVAIQGMSVKEASTAVGCLAATMHWRLHMARKRLSRELQHHIAP